MVEVVIRAKLFFLLPGNNEFENKICSTRVCRCVNLSVYHSIASSFHALFPYIFLRRSVRPSGGR